MTITRLVVLALALPYALVGLLPLGLVVFAAAGVLQHPDLAAAGLGAASIGLVVAAPFFAAAVGLLRNKRWSRWPVLGIAALALALVISRTPFALELYGHYRQPPPGAYVVLTTERFLEMFIYLYLVPLGLFLFSLLAALLVLRHVPLRQVQHDSDASVREHDA